MNLSLFRFLLPFVLLEVGFFSRDDGPEAFRAVGNAGLAFLLEVDPKRRVELVIYFLTPPESEEAH